MGVVRYLELLLPLRHLTLKAVWKNEKFIISEKELAD